MGVMASIYAGLKPEQVRAHREALERFARWQESAGWDPSPAVALSGVALLFDLLPVSSRQRPIDPSGVAALHRALSVLTATRR
jgi:hypothetical protein